MAGLKMEVQTELRTCIVKNRKALFHRWNQLSKAIPPSPMIGGHGGGIIANTVGIIEYEDGVVTECYPHEIKFIDNKFQEYSFIKEDK